MEFAYREIQGCRLAVTNHAQCNLRSWSHLRYSNLQGATVHDLLPVKFGDYVAGFEAAAACRRIRRDLGNDCPGGIRQIEEVCIVWRDIIHANAEIAVFDFAVFDDLFGCGARNLRGNREARAGKGAAVRDDEGVYADQFAMRVHQRSAGVSGIDGGVGLNVAARLARVIRVGIRPVNRADDATGDRELEVAEWAAKSQHSLSRLQFRRVSPRDGGKVGRVHFEHGNVGQFVDADYLRVQSAAIVQRHPDLCGAIHHVIVGHNVSVRRDDDAASHAVFDLRLEGLLKHGPEELLQARRKALNRAGGRLAGATRGDCDVDHGGSYARSNRLHGTIERSERRNAVVVERRSGVNVAVTGEDYGAQCERSHYRCRSGKHFCVCY